MDRRIRIEADEKSAAQIPGSPGDRAIKFFEQLLVHTTGDYTGQPFRLASWQRHDLLQIFGRVDEHGKRIIRTVYIRVPKKSGKSEVAAGVTLKLLTCDDEPGAEVYGAAADRDQAGIIYRVAASMVRRQPLLWERCKVIDSTKRIIVPHRDAFYRVLSSEVAGKHGFNSHGVIFDEVHTQADMRLWEVLTFGAGAARRQPLIYAITTAGIPGESPVAEMLDDTADQVLRGVIPCPPSFYPVIYAAPDGADWHDEEVWRACNPAMGTDEEIRQGTAFLRIESVREEYQRALRHTHEQNSFRRLRLNQWVSQETRWIDMDDWDRGGKLAGPDSARSYQAWVRSEVAELKDLVWYGGLDLSTKRDITAFVLVCRDGNDLFHVLPWFWLPRDNMTDRPNMEAAKYREWINQGFMIATPGDSVDFASVRRRIMELSGELKIQQIAFDPAFATETAAQLKLAGQTMVEFKQGPMLYTEPMIEFESAIRDGRLRHGGHPVLRWMADCVAVKQNATGLIRPVKPDRQKSGKRIDGIVATLMGLQRALLDETNRASVYADPLTAVI